jgi:signal transduction histidine kinase
MPEREQPTVVVPGRAAPDAVAADNCCAPAPPEAGQPDGTLRLWSLMVLAFSVALVGWILLSPAKGAAQRLPVVVGNVLAPLIALACTAPLAARLWRRGRDEGGSGRWSAACFSLGFASFAAAQCTWYYFELLRRQPPFPSWADAGYLLAYPFLIAAVLMLPSRPLGATQRGRVVMDSLMTIAATATFSWYFLLGPTLLASSQTLVAKLLASAYPVADLLVLFCLLLTVARARGARPEPGLLPLCLGLLVVVVTDVVFGYQALHNAYVSGTLLDAGWPLGYALLAVGARAVLVARPLWRDEAAPANGPETAGVETLLPYALVPMVGVLVIATLQEPSGPLVAGVYLGSGAIVLLIVLRQVLTIRQNARLYAELSRAYAQLELSHRSLESANRTLAQTEERIRAAAESASDYIYELDFDTGGLEWLGTSRGAAGPSGVSMPQSMQAWQDLVHPEDRQEAVDAFRRQIAAGDRFDLEYRIVGPGGEARHWSVRGRVTHRDGATARRAVGAVSDVTGRKRAEALEGERAGLRQAVSAMEGVLGVVGHELRTPLAGLRAMSEFLLTDGASGSAECEQMLAGINEEVVRMSETVNDLLEAARLNSGLAKWRWSTFDLRAPCEEAIDPVRPLVDAAKVRIECDVEWGLTMQGDADAVRRLVLNLLSNARKYTSAGTIRVSAGPSPERGEGWVEILVSDTGAGIPPEIRERLGEAFALNAGLVGANHVNGTGLGLAICKGIAAAHGGGLSVRSELGKGTTVVATLRRDLPGPATEIGKTIATGGRALTAGACGPGLSAA